MATYKQIYNFSSLKLNSTEIKEFMLKYPIDAEFKVSDHSSLVGIEVEVENLPTWYAGDPIWHVTVDGSLRNHGKEYISRPIRSTQIEFALRTLFKNLEQHNYKFSPRCSVHVHMNARTLQPKHLRALLLLYLTFERSIFRFIGNNRDRNIHCVPLLDCFLTNNIFDIVDGQLPPSVWMKYTALNLVPLGEKGTIEFRHMHGTDDITKLMTWINIILSLKVYAYKTPPELITERINSLNTTSQYRQFIVEVFGNLAGVFIDDVNDKHNIEIEEGSSFVKKILCYRTVLSQIKRDQTSDNPINKFLGITKTSRVQSKKFGTYYDDPMAYVDEFNPNDLMVHSTPVPEWLHGPINMSINSGSNT